MSLLSPGFSSTRASNDWTNLRRTADCRLISNDGRSVRCHRRRAASVPPPRSNRGQEPSRKAIRPVRRMQRDCVSTDGDLRRALHRNRDRHTLRTAAHVDGWIRARPSSASWPGRDDRASMCNRARQRDRWDVLHRHWRRCVDWPQCVHHRLQPWI